MSRYIFADLKRVFKRVPLLIIVAVLIWVCGSIDRTVTEGLAMDIVDQTKKTFIYACVPAGFLSLIFILGEDLRAKTAQIAIGIGISREKVVLAKWLECVIFTAVCELVMICYSFITASMHSAQFTASDWGEVLLVLLTSVVATGVYMAIVFPIIIASNGISVAMLVYVFLSTGLINKGLGYLDFIKPIQKLHIIGKTPTNLLNVCRTRMILGHMAIGQWIGVILFMAAFLGLSIFIYRKQELEF